MPGSDGAAASEIEQLISEAARSREQSRYDAVLRALAGHELFLNASRDRTTGELELATYPLGPMQHTLRLFLSKTHPQLEKAYAGVPWQAAAAILEQAPAIEGVQVVNEAGDWVAFDRVAVLRGQGKPATS